MLKGRLQSFESTSNQLQPLLTCASYRQANSLINPFHQLTPAEKTFASFNWELKRMERMERMETHPPKTFRIKRKTLIKIRDWQFELFLIELNFDTNKAS